MHSTEADPRTANLANIERETGIRFIPDWPRYYASLEDFTIEEKRRESRINNWHGEELVPLTENIVLPIDHNSSFNRAFYISRSFEPANLVNLARFVKSDDVILDIGAHYGIFSLVSAHLSGPKGRVYAFEASSREYNALRKSINCNPTLADRILAQHLAVSNKSSELTINISDDFNDGLNTLASKFSFDVKSIRREKITAISIDDFVESHALKSVDFIKVDVEGMECHVLEGAKDTIRRFRPAILIEYLPEAIKLAHRSSNQLLNQIRKHDYSLHAVNDNNADLVPVTNFEETQYNNFILCPTNKTNFYWDT